MAVRLNENREIVNTIKEGLKEKKDIVLVVSRSLMTINASARSSETRSQIRNLKDIATVCCIIKRKTD